MRLITPLDGPYIQCGNKKMLDFSSTDFLGLAQHPDVKKNAIKYTLRYGVGIPSITLISAPQQQLEEKVAQFLGMETATFFYDLEHAKAALENFKVTISQTPPAGKEKNLFCYDNSKTFGILGDRGIGFAKGQKGHDFILGTFSEGGGSFGAYIATSQAHKKKLPASVNFSPSTLGALDEILNLIPEMDAEREQLAKHTAWIKKMLTEKGLKAVSDPPLPVVSVAFATEEDAEKFAKLLTAEEIFVSTAIQKQLSFYITALHTPDDLDQLECALKNVLATDAALATQSLTPTPRK